MADNAFVKVVFGGKMQTYDTWSIGLAFKVAGGTPSEADMNGIANGFSVLWATDVWDASGGLKSLVNTTTDWSKCQTYYYPAGSNVATVVGTKVITPDPGTFVTTQIPPQLAMVVTLKTGFSGRRFTGRVYLPGGGGISTNGQIGGGTVSGLATKMAQFLSDCNDATVGALSFNACIGTGNTPLITEVVMDSVFDTQRRRRDKQVANSKSVAPLP